MKNLNLFKSNVSGMDREWIENGSGLTRHHGKLWKYAAMIALLLTLVCGKAWAVNSAFTQGEILYVNGFSDNAWGSDACVKAEFSKNGSNAKEVDTHWMFNKDGGKLFYIIVPTDRTDYSKLRLHRYDPSNCSSHWNYNGDILQSNRSSDDYNMLYSDGTGNANSGWKSPGETYKFDLYGSTNSWASAIGTMEHVGNGKFFYGFTFTAVATSYNFKLRDSWSIWWGASSDGNDVTLSGLTVGKEYYIYATMDLATSLNYNGGSNPRSSLQVKALEVHEPGVYESASGYNKPLKTYSGYDYEIYRYSKSSSNWYVFAGESLTTNTSDKHCLLEIPASSDYAAKTLGWILHRGGVSGNTSSASNTAGEFSAVGSSQAMKCYQNPGTYGQGYTLFVKGYDKFHLWAQDKDVSKSYIIKVYVNGSDVTDNSAASLTIREYALDPSETSLIQIQCLGTTSSNTDILYGFSLRVPAVTTYTVSYDANGGDANPSSTTQASSGASITLPAAPSYTGYTFNGWYTETSGGTRRGGAGDTYVPASNETLHAQWTVKTTTLTLQSGSNGTGADQTSTATYGSGTLTSFTLHTANSGYALRGYYTAATGGVKVLDYDGSIVHATTAYTTSGGNWASELSSLTLTAQYDQEPTTVEITGTYHYFPGETISLSSSVTGAEGDATYSWDKNSSQLGTSSTYTKANCTTADAGGYLLTVCNGRACKTSAAFDVKILQFYLKNSGGGDISNGAFTHNDGTTTASITVNLDGNTTYKFRVTDGCGDWYGNSGKMTVSDCYDWPMNADADCQIETTVTGSYVFTVNYANLAAMTVSVLYPTNDQAAGKKIWFDNSVEDFGTPYYRIGHNQNNTSTAMTKVYGTANLYEVTTAEYNGSSAWNITNNVGKLVNVYYTKTNDGDAITKATAFIGNCVTETPGVTITPGTDHSTGGADNNNNCEFYSYTRVTGMKTDRVTISDYSNGTITVNYTNTSNVASTLTSGYADLAHTVVLTSITAVADDGYDASAITINGNPYSANHVVTGATTIAASFSLKTYTISYNAGTNGSGSRANDSKTHGVNFTLPGSTFSYTGHAQDGWATSDGGATAYALSGSYTTNAAQTFYPHWKCNTPTITDNGDNTVTITVPSGTTVRYTTDGTNPSSSSGTVYSSAFSIVANCTVKAIAYQSGCTDSEIASQACTYSAGADGCWDPENTAAEKLDENDVLLTKFENQFSGVAGITSVTIQSKGTSTGQCSGADETTPSGYMKVKNAQSSGTKIITIITTTAKDITIGGKNYGDNTGSFHLVKSTDESTKLAECSTGSSDEATNCPAGTYYIYAVATNKSINFSLLCIEDATPCTTPTTTLGNGAYTVGGSALDLSTLISSSQGGGAITYTVTDANGTGATIAGTSFTASSAGTASIRATQAANGVYCEKVMNATVTVSAAAGHTVTYQYNGATGSATPASATGASVTLPTPTKTDCSFQGWYTSGGTKAGDGGDTYNPEADITLHALWRADCTGGGGNKTLVDINFKDASWSGKTFSQANDNNEDLINGVYFWSKDASRHFSLADNTSKGLTFPNSNMSSGSTYFCIPITGINSSDKQITVTLKHGYSSNKASYKYVYIDGRTTFVDANTNGSGGEAVSDAANADTQISFTKSSLSNTSGHLIIGRNSSSYTQIYGVTVTTPNNATCYYVTYNGNGADGGFMTDETAHGSGDNVAILENTFTRTGYTFTGWKTAPSSGTSYSPEGTITGISSNITLYAQWSAGTLYSVTYNGNGATSGSVPVDPSSPYASGANVTVLGNTGTLALANYTFDGWATANDGTGTSYIAEGTISSIAADVELFAKWKQTVTLNTGSQGSEEEKTPYIYINGAALNGFSAHSAAGYTLNGYYSAASGGTKVLEADGSFAATDVANYVTGGKWSRTDATTLYAQWRAAAGSTCYEWDATKTAAETGTNSYDGLYLTANTTTSKQLNNSSATEYTCFDISAKAKTLYGHLNGTEIASVKFAASTNNTSYTTVFIAFCSSTTFDVENIIQVGGYDATVYTVNKNDAAKSEFTVSAPAGTKSFAIGRNMDGLTYSSELQIGQNRYLYYLYVCSASGGTHTISYNAGGGTGTMTSDADIADDGTKTLKTNTFTAPTNYSFAGWVADVNVTIGGSTVTAGTLIANGATITNITSDIALTAKWSQSVTLDDNDENHGATGDGSATAYYNATSLSSIAHTEAATGYKLAGYYTAKTDGTKVLNANGSFASANVTDWISGGKWICTESTRTLYAQYESAGALTWNLIVNSDTANLSTLTKSSAFTEIAVVNMTDAAVNGVDYTHSKKANLTGKISTPAEDADKYVKVTFKVASGYKFIPSLISVPVQPVGNNEHKAVKLSLTDESSHSLVSSSATKCDGTSDGKKTTVTLAGDGSKFFTDSVTLKIYVYPHESASASSNNCYRLGTPITIEGEVEETCGTMPSYSSMTYSQTEYTIGDDASAISVVGGANIDTYQWMYGTTNDRSSGDDCGSNNPSYTPSTEEDMAGTYYYWCNMTNDDCGITIQSPAVAITVSASKSNATIDWTGTTSSGVNYGGGGYTVKATVSPAGWNGNAEDLTITAPAGIRIYNVTSGTDASSKKYVQANFDVQTAFDRTTYEDKIPFTVSADATGTYNAISATDSVSYSACTGGGSAEEYLMPVNADSVNSTVKGWRFTGTGKMWFGHGSSTPSTGSSIKSLSNTMADEAINKYYNSGGSYFSFYTEKAITGVRLYVYTSNSNVKVSNVYIANSQFTTGTPSSGAVTYDVVYNDDNEGLDKGDNVYSAWAEITFASEVAAGKYGLIKLDNNVKIAGIGLLSGSSSGASLTTTLAFATAGPIAADASTANFTNTASLTSSNTNSLGAITYSSNNSAASVNATTGEVSISAKETAQTVTITATLAASGCYKGATATYTINVAANACSEPSGSIELTSGSASKCSSESVTLTMTGFTSGATVQWYDGSSPISSGGSYTIATEGSTSTLTTTAAGTYSAIAASGCTAKRTNSITISNKSAEASAEKIVDSWYVKNGRLTPDIALWTLSEGATFGSVAFARADEGDATAIGLSNSDCYAQDGIVYLKGKAPSSNDTGADIEYTLTLTVNDACGGSHIEDTKTITLIHQKNTDKHVLAFVVTGTENGSFTAGIKSSETGEVGLYKTIGNNFDVLPTNIYSTSDKKKLKEYYSQFDILCITDYPNTKKGDYVNAMGSLIDIRPILTMEAYVSNLANWRAKGISGDPMSPTTR